MKIDKNYLRKPQLMTDKNDRLKNVYRGNFMKMNFKALFVVAITVGLSTACSTATSKDCVSCEMKKVSDSVQPDKAEAMRLKEDLAKPVALATKGPLVLNSNGVSRAPAEEKNTKEDYQYIFCHRFVNIDANLVGYTLKEMEATSFSVEELLNEPTCQPEKYSAAVKSPMSHIIADDPSKRVGWVESFWLYYSKKRKEPAKFLDFVNAKNTEGETLLDYLETMINRGEYPSEGSKASIAKIIASACSHGAVYSKHTNKKCP